MRAEPLLEMETWTAEAVLGCGRYRDSVPSDIKKDRQQWQLAA